jgi:hypothetical protein
MQSRKEAQLTFREISEREEGAYAGDCKGLFVSDLSRIRDEIKRRVKRDDSFAQSMYTDIEPTGFSTPHG